MTVEALALAGLAQEVPLTQSSTGTSLVVEQTAVLVALLQEWVPHAVQLLLTRVLRILAVLAFLLALALDRGRGVVDPKAHAMRLTLVLEGILRDGPFSGDVVDAIPLATANGSGFIPHTPGVAVAGGLGCVLVHALAPAGIPGRIELALIPHTASGLVACAEITVENTLFTVGIPAACLASITRGLALHLLTSLVADSSGAGLIPVALSVFVAAGLV